MTRLSSAQLGSLFRIANSSGNFAIKHLVCQPFRLGCPCGTPARSTCGNLGRCVLLYHRPFHDYHPLPVAHISVSYSPPTKLAHSPCHNAKVVKLISALLASLTVTAQPANRIKHALSYPRNGQNRRMSQQDRDTPVSPLILDLLTSLSPQVAV